MAGIHPFYMGTWKLFYSLNRRIKHYIPVPNSSPKKLVILEQNVAVVDVLQINSSFCELTAHARFVCLFLETVFSLPLEMFDFGGIHLDDTKISHYSCAGL